MDNADNGRSKALLIGIQYKGQRHRDKRLDLKGPRKDVEAMKDYLINTWNYPSKNIFELLDEPEYVQPTRTNILKYLDVLVQAPTPKTRLFLYFSGHGRQVQTGSKTELDGKDETLVPLDWGNGLIRDNVLYDRVVKLPPGCRFTAVFDCCHSGTLLDLPYTREKPLLVHPDEYTVSPVTTMYYTALQTVFPISVSAHPDRVLEHQGHCATELSGKKLPQLAMTHPPHAQESSDSRNRPFRESVKLPRKAALEPKVHWVKKWFEVFRKPVYAPDINAKCSIACLAPFSSQLGATHADEVGYPLRRECIGHDDVVYISPISESFAESGSQIPWGPMTRTLEEPPSKALDAQPSESQASPSAPRIRDPLLLPTVFSIGACADSEEVTEGIDTSAGLLRIALIQCLAEAKDRTWLQLLGDLRHFANTSPEFESQKKVWPVIASIKPELTEIVEF